MIAIRRCTFVGSTQNLTIEKRDPRGEISGSRRGIDACQVARRSELQIVRYAAARARIRPYGEQSRFFLFFSPKNPLTVCLCRVPKIGGLINSSNYGLSPLMALITLGNLKRFSLCSHTSRGRA